MYSISSHVTKVELGEVLTVPYFISLFMIALRTFFTVFHKLKALNMQWNLITYLEAILLTTFFPVIIICLRDFKNLQSFNHQEVVTALHHLVNQEDRAVGDGTCS